MKHDPVDVELTSRDKEFVAAGVERFCKRLDALKKENAEVQKTAEQQDCETEAAGLRAELVEPLQNGTGRILVAHLVAVRKGLEILAVNQKAGKGTVLALAHPEWAATLEEESAYVSQVLAPKFDAQLSLDVRPLAGAGDGLKDLAEAEADQAERSAEEPAPVLTVEPGKPKPPRKLQRAKRGKRGR